MNFLPSTRILLYEYLLLSAHIISSSFVLFETAALQLHHHQQQYQQLHNDQHHYCNNNLRRRIRFPSIDRRRTVVASTLEQSDRITTGSSSTNNQCANHCHWMLMRKIQTLLMSVVVVLMSTISTIPSTAQAITITGMETSAVKTTSLTSTSSSTFVLSEIQQQQQQFKFKAPTIDRPQISFPTSTSTSTGTGTSSTTNFEIPKYLEGLVYLPKSKVLQQQQQQDTMLYPTSTRNMILSVRTIERPDHIVAGATVPLSRIAMMGSKSSTLFSFQFRMNSNNVITPVFPPSTSSSKSVTVQERNDLIWNDLLMNHDVIVQAIICNNDVDVDDDIDNRSDNEQAVTRKIEKNNKRKKDIHELLDICSTSKPVLFGQGVGKLIKYTPDSDSTTDTRKKDDINSSNSSNNQLIIRAPVSIPLGIV